MGVILTGLGGGGIVGSYMLVVAALVLLVLCFACNKYVQKRMGSGVTVSLLFTCVRGLMGGAMLFAAYCIINRRLPVVRGYSLIMAGMLAVLVCVYTMLGFKIMSFGSMSVFTVFLMLGGMIVPYLYGVIWLDEKINAPRVIGIVLMVISMFFPLIGDNIQRGRASAGDTSADLPDTAGGDASAPVSNSRRVIFCVLCLLVFLLNGFVSVISKTHAAGILKFESSDSMTFAMLCQLSCGTISGVILAAVKLFGSRKPDKPDSGTPANFWLLFRAVLVFIALAALFDAASFFFQQLGAAALPASVMYPLMTGGSIVLSALAGFVLFKEKQTKIALIGLAITFAATFLFLF